MRDKETQTPLYAFNAGVAHRSLKGLDPRMNPKKSPRNFRDTMKALDKQAWAAAYNSEYLGFKQREVFKIVKPEPGVRIHYTLTRLEYMVNSLNAKCVCAQEGTNKNLATAALSTGAYRSDSLKLTSGSCWSPLAHIPPLSSFIFQPRQCAVDSYTRRLFDELE